MSEEQAQVHRAQAMTAYLTALARFERAGGGEAAVIASRPR
jgi:hypothetical protein